MLLEYIYIYSIKLVLLKISIFCFMVNMLDILTIMELQIVDFSEHRYKSKWFCNTQDKCGGIIASYFTSFTVYVVLQCLIIIII